MVNTNKTIGNHSKTVTNHSKLQKSCNKRQENYSVVSCFSMVKYYGIYIVICYGALILLWFTSSNFRSTLYPLLLCAQGFYTGPALRESESQTPCCRVHCLNHLATHSTTDPVVYKRSSEFWSLLQGDFLCPYVLAQFCCISQIFVVEQLWFAGLALNSESVSPTFSIQWACSSVMAVALFWG